MTSQRRFPRVPGAVLPAALIALVLVLVGAAGSADAAPRSTRSNAPQHSQAGPRWRDPATLADPTLPDGSGAGRRVVYSVTRQRVWLVDGAEQVQTTYLVSGRRGIPRPGTYQVFSTSRYSRSGSLRLEYMVRFARGARLAVGFHSIPTGRRGPIQSEDELGQFRSRGCVRQRLSDAAALWAFAPVGTTVVVTP